MKHHGQELVNYIITLCQHTNDALDLNEEITSLVDQHEAMQDNLEAVKTDLASTCLHTKKLSQELAKKEGQLRDTHVEREDTGSRSINWRSPQPPSRIKWPDAPILTDGVSPTFEAWAQKIVQKTDRTYSDPQNQIDYTCARVGERAEAYLAPCVCVDTTMPFHSWDEVLEFLCGIMADPNPQQTARHKLDTLTQGKLEFAEFYGQFITQVVDLDYSEWAQIDILLDKVDKRLKRAWDMNVNPPSTLNEVRRQLMTLDQNMCQTDKCFPLSQPQTASCFSTAKVAVGSSKPSPPAVSETTTKVTVQPHPFNTSKLSEADVTCYQKEGRCFKCGQQGHMKGDCPKTNPQIKNMNLGDSSEEDSQESSKND